MTRLLSIRDWQIKLAAILFDSILWLSVLWLAFGRAY